MMYLLDTNTVSDYLKGNSGVLKYLQAQYPQSRIALIWDGASYHRSKEVKNYLNSINQGLEPRKWKITCIRFAPNAPEQNPIEDVWRECQTFCARIKFSLLFLCDRHPLERLYLVVALAVLFSTIHGMAIQIKGLRQRVEIRVGNVVLAISRLVYGG